jgi:hypothetical protein
MPRAYTIATAALALGVSPKWIDNALSHHRVKGVTQKKQGISRRLSIDGLLILSLALLSSAELGTSLANALQIADQLVANGGRLRFSHGLMVELDLEQFRNQLLSKLEHAVEVAPIPTRGRPPKNTTGRLE